MLFDLALAAEPTALFEGFDAVGERALVAGDFAADGAPDLAVEAVRNGAPILVLWGDGDTRVLTLPTDVGRAALWADGTTLVVGIPEDGGGAVTLLEGLDTASSEDAAADHARFTVHGVSGAALGVAVAAADLDGDGGLETLGGDPADGYVRTWAEELEGPDLDAETVESGHWSVDNADAEALGLVLAPFAAADGGTDIATVYCPNPWAPETGTCDGVVALVLDGAGWDDVQGLSSAERLVGTDDLAGFPTALAEVTDPRDGEGTALLWASAAAVQLVDLEDPRSVTLTVPGATAGAVLDCGGEARLVVASDTSLHLVGGIETSWTLPSPIARILAVDLDLDGRDEAVVALPEARAVWVVPACVEDSEADTGADTGAGTAFGWACRPCDERSAAILLGVGLAARRRRHHGSGIGSSARADAMGVPDGATKRSKRARRSR